MYFFGKSRRIFKTKDFELVFRNSERMVVFCFILLFWKNLLGDTSRLGIVLSKRIIKKSCNRNNIKRLIKETFRLITFINNLDIVILVNAKIVGLSNQCVIYILNDVWKKIQKINI
ncbi:ribonuclease P protein component [Candidatus Legionella polyplacis]|uniref:Ribonuclease P protein component n=1 Tax=Candidatus Legionella polyplacis TaxID=2005262 RepID=A0ABZ2GZK0_9GAMM